MRVVKYIGLFVAVAVVTGAVTLGALVWGPAFLDQPAAAADSVVVWPEAIAERTVPKPPPTVERITILAVGDLMMHTPQLSSAKTADGYDFTSCFAPVAPRISAADLAVGNFETVLAGADRGYTGYPTFNSPDSYAQAAVGAGFDVLTHANNHTLDRGPTGLVRTREVFESLGVLTTGTARTSEEAAEILIADVRGVRIAILAYTYGMNGFTAPSDKPWMVNVINQPKMTSDVERARDLGVDLVVVSIHNGIEYQRQPSASQAALEQAMVDAGADVVLGSHPHVIQPMTVVAATRADGTPRDAFIIHSLGNFVSNQRERFRNTGLMLELGFEKDLKTGVTSLVSAEYVPVWVDDTAVDGREHRILPIRDALDDPEYPGVDASDRAKLEQAWSDTTTHLGGSGETSGDPAAVVFWGEPLER
ncbi:MAG: CapA family protein [Coriobacteriia bacterium]|nr:CapA family protein [Coriobacteriia bacterium]